ncbi:hypothetical protein PGT21_022708 [Puccinia graminis f. sp. tritici]|uniref:Uncharacterized protein n=1 Tax=Puccinia graminis f. sp. tritici TaxID=56615 RepID=A0A5B0PLS8_PUCGR|nr:hypothetical protein PGT21_022708 [Puccinia graminis f. sp. tritici]
MRVEIRTRLECDHGVVSLGRQLTDPRFLSVPRRPALSWSNLIGNRSKSFGNRSKSFGNRSKTSEYQLGTFAECPIVIRTGPETLGPLECSGLDRVLRPANGPVSHLSPTIWRDMRVLSSTILLIPKEQSIPSAICLQHPFRYTLS